MSRRLPSVLTLPPASPQRSATAPSSRARFASSTPCSTRSSSASASRASRPLRPAPAPPVRVLIDASYGSSMGCEIYIRITGLAVNGSTDYKCTNLRTDAPWYRATISPWYYFITAPCYLLALSLRNGQPLLRKETLIMVVVGCAGVRARPLPALSPSVPPADIRLAPIAQFCCNYFSGRVFTNRPDIASAIGAFVVGILGGLYAKLSRGSAFVIMVRLVPAPPSPPTGGPMLRRPPPSPASPLRRSPVSCSSCRLVCQTEACSSLPPRRPVRTARRRPTPTARASRSPNSSCVSSCPA